ncbi:LysR family transcriptional regulator [Solirubrobacter soli]|uniref:LysR family transcriptional regulator n=1 Tax=Solirubrobacter soli TaxID=363832 RepID=UPI000419A127|nr:LysR family transcriptional regulator [Solirubrobacter soli]
MLDLRRLRLLKELHERGTIAAVADALQFTPSAVSQQLAMLERETNVTLLQKAGRGVRLTDPALVLVEHATALLDRAARAEADLAAAAGTVVGRARIATFQSVALTLAIPMMERLKHEAPRLRTELIEAEPEQALPALALGDLDLVLGDEWQHQPLRLPPGLERQELFDDPVHVALPERLEHASFEDLAHEPWTTGHPGMAWEEMTRRACRELGAFEPDIRHRTNDATVSLALVAHGLAVALVPGLAIPQHHPGVVLKPTGVKRRILAVVREADAARPSVQALVAGARG